MQRIVFVERPDVSDLPDYVATTCGDQVFWDVVVSGLAPEMAAPAEPLDYSSAWLQLRGFSMSYFGLPGAAELAMLRHRFAANVRSVSPESIVFGGQHEGRDGWWAETNSESQRVIR